MQDAQDPIGQQPATEARHVPLPLRHDTLLGICEGLGEDLGFNPLWLRVALSSGVLWNPVAIVGIYLGLGVLVLASRLLFPPARKAAVQAAPAEQPVEQPQVQPRQQREQERELIAA